LLGHHTHRLRFVQTRRGRFAGDGTAGGVIALRATFLRGHRQGITALRCQTACCSENADTVYSGDNGRMACGFKSESFVVIHLNKPGVGAELNFVLETKLALIFFSREKRKKYPFSGHHAA